MNTHSLKRKERDRQVRKTDILSAAEQVFALKGYEKATIQDIASQAQYAAGTVYLYFKDKDELYLSMLEDKVSEMMSVVVQKTSGIKDAGKKLKLFIETSIDFFEKDRYFFRVFISETSKFRWAIDKKITTSPLMARHLNYLIGLVKMAQRQGVVRDDFNAEHVADIFAAILSTTIVGLLKDNPGKFRYKNSPADFIFDVFINGVGA
jgi:AcrR family transcriptional regulator